MKLFKSIALAAMALLVSATAYADGKTFSGRESLDEVRIYINPGHGSWGPNNRHMATLGDGGKHQTISTTDPDTTDFFESNTNLRKGLALLQRLRDYGMPFDETKNQTNENPNRVGAALDLTQNLVMSHVKCGPFPYDSETTGTTSSGSTYIVSDQNNDFNRTLSVIAAEVDANDFDMFISIHSNAATDGNTVNYLYFALDGYGSDTDKDNLSYEISRCGWNHRIQDRHTKWTHYDYSLAESDMSAIQAATKGKIGKQKLGVLNHDVPGYLVEGYFHTYQPSRHRYMNFDMCRLEGVDYARGVADYFGWEKEKTGDVVGVVRDYHELYSESLYTPNASTNDIYKPLNDVVVTLLDSEGKEVATDTTDVHCNGVFVFRDLTPGTYSVKFAHADYKPYVTTTSYKDHDSDAKEIGEEEAMTITISEATTIYPEAFIETTNYEPPTVTYVNYPDYSEGLGYTIAEKYRMYNRGENTAIAELVADKTIRRTILRDGKLYVLALDAENVPAVYVVDTDNNTLVKTLTATTATGTILPLSDIALTADGVLVGINKAYHDYGVTDENIKVYKWTNGEDGLPEGDAADWFGVAFAGNWTNGIGGEAITYDGTLAEGNLIYTGSSTAGATRLIICTIANGERIGYYRNNQDGTYMTTKYTGETFSVNISPNTASEVIVNSDAVTAFEAEMIKTDTKPVTIKGEMSADLENAKSANESYFKYAGRSLMVAPAINADGKVSGVNLYDITDGVAAATLISTTTTLATPVEYTYASAHGELVITRDAITNEIATANEIELFLVVDGKVTKFSTAAPPAVSVTPALGGTANPFAYALSSEVADGVLNVKYSLNTAATAVKVVVKNEADEEVASAEGAVEAGAQTVAVNVADLAAGKYTWEVSVTGETKTTISYYKHWDFYHPCGLDVDNSFESESFGTLLVAEGYTDGKTSGYVSAQAGGTDGGGLYMIDAAGNLINNAVTESPRFYPEGLTHSKYYATSGTAGADFSKVAIADDGRIFVTRFNDLGDYILVAPSVAELAAEGNSAFTSLVSGMEMTSGVYNDSEGNFLLGPVQAFDVKGSGEDVTLLAITRPELSLTASYEKNRTFEYSLSDDNALSTPESTALDMQYTIAYDRSANVAYDNRGGIWYCQYRGTPDNSSPALVYVDAEGKVQFFEGEGGKVRRKAALAVSPDGNYLAAASAAGYFSVYEIEYDTDGAVNLTEIYYIKSGGNNLYSLAWDAAGNVYAGNASTEYVRGYAIPRTAPAVTKAASKYAFEITGSSAIENVGEDVEAPVEYYNLQGVKVANPSNGIFIKKQGSRTTKVVL